MNWQKALENIESHEFAAEVNIASHLGMFLAIARESESVRFVQAQLKDAGRVAELTTRAYQRTQEPVDPRYENRWDVSLAVYLWLLATENPKYASSVAYSVLVTPQCWWAHQLARQIIPGAYEAEDTFEIEVPISVGAFRTYPANNADVGETVLVSAFSPNIAGGSISFVQFGDTQQPEGMDSRLFELFAGGIPHWNAQTEDAKSDLEPIGAR